MGGNQERKGEIVCVHVVNFGVRGAFKSLRIVLKTECSELSFNILSFKKIEVKNI